MPDEKKPNGWMTVLKVFGIVAASLFLLFVLAVGLVLGICALGSR